MPKATHAEQARVLTDIPNIGKSMAADLHSLGITTPQQVRAMDPLEMYGQLDRAGQKEFWSRTIKEITLHPDGGISFSLRQL